MTGNSVLIVDDENEFLASATFTLNSEGINNIITIQDSRKTEALLQEKAVSVIVLDMNMPYVSGWVLLPIIVRNYPETPLCLGPGEDGN